MDSIRKVVNDPSWWFTVIVAGIVVTILGSLLTDALKSAIPQLIARYKQSKQARNAADQQHVDFLVSHPDIMQMEFVDTGITIGLVIFVTLLLIGLPGFAVAMRDNPNFHVLKFLPRADSIKGHVVGVFLLVSWLVIGLLLWIAPALHFGQARL